MYELLVWPLPSWPHELLPQQLTSSLVIAHVWASPAATAVAGAVRRCTSTGTLRWVLVPSPSWPLPLYPQHDTAPSVSRMAQ